MISPEVQALIELHTEAQHAWVNGTVHPLYDLSESSLFGPFGGAKPPRLADDAPDGVPLAARQAATAAQFHDGTTEVEVLQVMDAGDFVCLVVIERGRARFDGPDLQRWELRVTAVYRRRGDGWVMVHRHADPLVDGRDLHATLGLLDAG